MRGAIPPLPQYAVVLLLLVKAQVIFIIPVKIFHDLNI